MGSFFCPISISWKQQNYNYTGRVKRWQVSTIVPLCSSAVLILPGTKERTSTNAASVLYGWIYEATRVETPRKCHPQTTTQECSQISFSKEDTERSASRERRIHHGCYLYCVTWSAPISRMPTLLEIANTRQNSLLHVTVEELLLMHSLLLFMFLFFVW